MITPSFALDFTSASLDPRVTFARSGDTATVVNSSGSVVAINADLPRFDYDPITLACRGLLVEESRINRYLWSEDLTQGTGWQNSGTTVSSNSTLSPSGVLSADKATATTTGSFIAGIFNSGTIGVVYTTSVFLKNVDSTQTRLLVRVGASAVDAYVNWSGATISSITNNVGTFTATSYGNGWYRLSATYTALEASQLTRIYPDPVSGTKAVYIWGSQMEVGVGATSYKATTTTAVTRNADVATITGTNFSDWWQATRGGVLVRARPGSVSGTRPWVQFDDNTADNIIALRGNTTNPELYIVDGGTPQAQIDAGTIAANTDYSMTAWWQTNDCKARLNNGAVVTDTTATIPTVTQARLGSDGTNYLNGHLVSINYYDTFSGQIYTRRKNKAVFSLL
jgi:hypothetical protein